MKNWISWIVAFAICAIIASAANADDASTIVAAKGLVARVLPTHADRFVIETIPADNDQDVLEIDNAADGRIVLRGNNGVSIGTALGWYLKYTAHDSISWCGDQLALSDRLPAVKEKVHLATPMKYRVYLNYCTFSYSMAWWDWARWQREIDWMALNGINMPLAITGQEAVWVNTFKRFGLNDEQMRQFMVGPAFFAWQFMGNIDSHGGPLPQGWIDSHITLGQQILARERELGMTPILQAFTGHVPVMYKQSNPKVRIDQQAGWCSFKEGIYQMDPTEPVFKDIGKAFIEEQTKLFGTDHFYAADPFHEGTPPRKDPEYLPLVGKAVFDTMQSADPAAVWVMQSWSLREPLAKSPPKDRILIMDLDGARYKKFDNFWDRPFVSGMIQNFGGRTQLGGALSFSLHPSTVKAEAPSCVGLGAFPEGMANNPLLYDAMYETAWSKPQSQDDWLHEYVNRRYGKDLPDAQSAWELLHKTAYSHGYIDSMICARPALKVHLAAPSGAAMSVGYKPIDLWNAWGELLKNADQLKSQDTYQFDVVDVGRQCLNNLAMPLQRRVSDAFEKGDRDAFHKTRDQFLQLATDMDRLAGTRRESLLGAWIADARRWGSTDAEKNQYEWNARMQVTIWGPEKNAAIFDYSWRQWSGLISGYYIPRWQMFFDMLDQQLAAGEKVDEAKLKMSYARPAMRANAFYSKLADWEEAWPRLTNPTFPSTPTGDSVAIARELYEKYAAVAAAIPDAPAAKAPVKKD